MRPYGNLYIALSLNKSTIII